MTDVLLLQRADTSVTLKPLATVRYVSATHDELPQHLLSDVPPAMLIIDSTMLTERTVRLVETLSRRNLLPQTTVWLKSMDPETVNAAWQLARFNVSAAFSQDDLHRVIRERTEVYLGSPASYLQHVRHVTCARTLRLMHLLETETPMRSLSMEKLARMCGTSRTGLYTCIAKAGLPTPEQLQMLFRLWPAVTSLRRGATIDQSAGSGGSLTDVLCAAHYGYASNAPQLRFAHVVTGERLSTCGCSTMRRRTWKR